MTKISPNRECNMSTQICFTKRAMCMTCHIILEILPKKKMHEIENTYGQVFVPETNVWK